jgi:uracil-DNA glycosylase
MEVRIEASWKTRLAAEFAQPYFAALVDFIKAERARYTVYPPGRLYFNAFDQCPFDAVKVVIIGQDPYHGPGQANGLCFSVNEGVPFPPSLRNIFKELATDLGLAVPPSGHLERWAQQGVLLLNSILTVRAGQAASHHGQGWEQFTDAVIECVSREKSDVVFLLWGKYAQQKGRIVDRSRHCVLTAGHPSPLSAQHFFGCRHFSRANDYLIQAGLSPIIW